MGTQGLKKSMVYDTSTELLDSFGVILDFMAFIPSYNHIFLIVTFYQIGS